MKLSNIKEKLFNKKDLSLGESSYLFNLILEGEVLEVDLASILIALKFKEETKDEILGATIALRKKSLKIKAPLNCVDTCGTGGDMSGTLNISTSAAIIAASAGANIAKHGNRSISSKSGSADMLEKLGYKIKSQSKELEKSLKDFNFCFMFAQNHHSAMKNVKNVRQTLATRTIFNLLGPLTNPASAKRQILGVFDKKWVKIHCEVLKDLGSERAMVVHGEDGLDEISLCSSTFIAELKDNKIKNYIFNPIDYGYKLINKKDILGKGPEYNAKAFLDILEAPDNSFQKIIELNAGAALYLAEKVNNLRDGFDLARKSIKTFKSKKFFEDMIKNQ